MTLLITLQYWCYSKSIGPAPRIVPTKILAGWGNWMAGWISNAAYDLSQITGSSRSDSGRIVLLGLLLLLLVGGVFLMVRSVADFWKDRRAKRREAGDDKRKAA
jgi:TRAP-type C4-dicarboxylate transport system permease small subunit